MFFGMLKAEIKFKELTWSRLANDVGNLCKFHLSPGDTLRFSTQKYIAWLGSHGQVDIMVKIISCSEKVTQMQQISLSEASKHYS